MTGVDDDDDYGFSNVPLAETVLAWQQNLGLLTETERELLTGYSGNDFKLLNPVLWGTAESTPSVERRIDGIRTALRKYPLPMSVRATRLTEASDFGIPGLHRADVEPAYSLIDGVFTHLGFMSTSGLADPRRPKTEYRNPVIVDLIILKGTPALRLGELAEVQAEKEVLVIDARELLVVGVKWDEARSMWRIKAIVTGGDE
ncbi:ADP-ribosyltransferase [Nocardia sp.]|uniref:ADP-ribosyltransferase n=1 Tax=Nocardia sp. TaxID=1821 RepID=UPI0026040A86|nr:ADP-ribosyltransferase [Nocardia sp.]